MSFSNGAFSRYFYRERSEWQKSPELKGQSAINEKHHKPFQLHVRQTATPNTAQPNPPPTRPDKPGSPNPYTPRPDPVHPSLAQKPYAR